MEETHPAEDEASQRKREMLRKATWLTLLMLGSTLLGNSAAEAQQAQGFGQPWGGSNAARDFPRFQHYPYVYYPQNFYGSEYYRSADSLYYRYPPEMQIPVYNRKWENFYPKPRRYHWGHHFITDVF
ncbi:MAG: calmodulin-binding protein [Pirellulaceae bacterium]